VIWPLDFFVSATLRYLSHVVGTFDFVVWCVIYWFTLPIYLLDTFWFWFHSCSSATFSIFVCLMFFDTFIFLMIWPTFDLPFTFYWFVQPIYSFIYILLWYLFVDDIWSFTLSIYITFIYDTLLSFPLLHYIPHCYICVIFIQSTIVVVGVDIIHLFLHICLFCCLLSFILLHSFYSSTDERHIHIYSDILAFWYILVFHSIYSFVDILIWYIVHLFWYSFVTFICLFQYCYSFVELFRLLLITHIDYLVFHHSFCYFVVIYLLCCLLFDLFDTVYLLHILCLLFVDRHVLFVICCSTFLTLWWPILIITFDQWLFDDYIIYLLSHIDHSTTNFILHSVFTVVWLTTKFYTFPFDIVICWYLTFPHYSLLLLTIHSLTSNLLLVIWFPTQWCYTVTCSIWPFVLRPRWSSIGPVLQWYWWYWPWLLLYSLLLVVFPLWHYLTTLTDETFTVSSSTDSLYDIVDDPGILLFDPIDQALLMTVDIPIDDVVVCHYYLTVVTEDPVVDVFVRKWLMIRWPVFPTVTVVIWRAPTICVTMTCDQYDGIVVGSDWNWPADVVSPQHWPRWWRLTPLFQLTWSMTPLLTFGGIRLTWCWRPALLYYNDRWRYLTGDVSDVNGIWRWRYLCLHWRPLAVTDPVTSVKIEGGDTLWLWLLCVVVCCHWYIWQYYIILVYYVIIPILTFGNDLFTFKYLHLTVVIYIYLFYYSMTLT